MDFGRDAKKEGKRRRKRKRGVGGGGEKCRKCMMSMTLHDSGKGYAMKEDVKMPDHENNFRDVPFCNSDLSVSNGNVGLSSAN